MKYFPDLSLELVWWRREVFKSSTKLGVVRRGEAGDGLHQWDGPQHDGELHHQVEGWSGGVHVEVQPVLEVHDGAGTGQAGGRERRDGEGSLPVVTRPGTDPLLPGQSLHLPLLRHALGPGLELHHLLQAEERPVHVSAGEVLHLHIELDPLATDVAGPVGVETGGDGTGLPAETAQSLLILRVTCQESLDSDFLPDSTLAFLLGCGQQVQVEEAVDHDVLLHLVVELPVPHDVGLHVVPDVPLAGLEGGGNVGRQGQTEGDDVVTSRQFRTLREVS